MKRFSYVRNGRCRISLSILLCSIGLFVGVGCSSDSTVSEGDLTPHLNKSDSLALVKIYQEIGPWHQDWDLHDITTWNGVTTGLEEESNEIRVIGLEVYAGQCHGILPKEICQLTELRRLVISGGIMQGNIPNDIGKLKNLIILVIADNNVTGVIPESIGELTSLRMLQLSNNLLSGTVPESIGNLKNLEYLYINDTYISGDVPKGIANMNKLKRVILTDNKFSGTFPIEILKNNILIECDNNNITELPLEVWNDSSDCVPPLLQGNRLSGEIPEHIKHTKKWEQYYVICTNHQQKGYGYSNVIYDN